MEEVLNGKFHPIISLYRDTKEGSFPLILIIGREPNDEMKMSDEVGEYNFDKKPVPFWNLPYDLLGSIINKTRKEFQDICREKQSSPIAFADISSCPIRSASNDKQTIRKAFTTKDYIDHLRIIASKNVFKRVKLVVFSGLDYPNWAIKRFGDAVKEVSSEWREGGLTIFSARFFTWRYKKEVEKSMQTVISSDTTKAILENWL